MVVHEGVGTHASLDTPGLTHAVVTPALLEGLMAAPEGAFARNDGLILSIVGGALSEALFDKVKARLTDNIRTSVGSTEGGGSTRTDVKTVEDLHWHKLTETSTLEVVGEDDQPLPPGQVGQVRVRQVEGVGAYLGDVDASAASFRDGYFYPGDLAVMDGQGRIRILGRIGDALNLRGDKLPAAPIEEAMQQALGCQCVCFSAHDASNADELHVVLETASPPDEARLTQAARAHGSGFPTARFHFVPQFPRTGTGKVERYRLREMIAAPRPA
jgi:acyl-coenzyme A synthetase/AMP-(fatty) acid ligase